MRRIAILITVGLVAAGCGDSLTGTDRPPVQATYPDWAPRLNTNTVVSLDYDDGLDEATNADRLQAAVDALGPGRTLLIGDGEWRLDAPLRIASRGTPDRPIAVQARPGTRPVLRPTDPGPSVLVDVGRASAVQYLVLRGLELTGPALLLETYMGSDVWFDDLLLRDGTSGMRLATWQSMQRVTVTQCVFENASSEGICLRMGNGVDRAVSGSVIAGNRFEGEQAGIVFETPSRDNRIVANEILGSRVVALRLAGSSADGPNLVERNTMIGGTEETMLQVSRFAVIRNNLVINDSPWASYAYSAAPAAGLAVIHNTFLADYAAVYLGSVGSDVVFANNAVYARDDRGLRISAAQDDGGVRGNVVFGMADQGTSWYRVGNGLTDFEDLTWDGASRDAHPTADGALVGAGVAAYHVDRDLDGLPRGSTVVAGAYRLP